MVGEDLSKTEVGIGIIEWQGLGASGIVGLDIQHVGSPIGELTSLSRKTLAAVCEYDLPQKERKMTPSVAWLPC
jgi:hypothetical protein